MRGLIGLTQLAVVAGIVGVVGGIAPAQAADLGSSAQPAAHAEADVNWSGLYIGLDGGIGLGEDLRAYNNGFEAVDDLKGGIGGIQGSVLRQTGHIVIGLEANADFAKLSGTHSNTNGFDYTAKITGLESMRAVLGLGAGRWLAYGTAGVGFEQVSEELVPVAGGDVYGAGQRTKTGWVVGGGVQTMLNDRISLGAQYLHYGFGSDNKDEINERTGIVGLNLDWRQSADVIEARLSFKLNGFETHVPMK